MNQNLRESERVIKGWQTFILAYVIAVLGILSLNPLPAFVEQEDDAALQSSLQSVYRLYNPYSGDHHYTTSKDE